MKQFILILLSVLLVSFTTVYDLSKGIPDRNIEFLTYLQKNGKRIAPTYQKANCVQFMDILLHEYAFIDEKTSERIYIKQDMLTIQKLLSRGDSTVVSGVCWALVETGKATWIKPENAKRGDIVQYWSTDGFINGHCGVLYDTDENGYVLLSSHPDSQGYGKMSVNNKNLSNFTLFIVRLK
jgi:hypothetical protein